MIPQLVPGQVADLRVRNADLGSSKMETLLRLSDVEITRTVVSQGEGLSLTPTSTGVVLLCLEGKVTIKAPDKTRELESGQLVYFGDGDFCALRGVDARSTVIVITHHQTNREPPGLDVVEEASEESFPASDAPGWSATSLGTAH